MRNRIPFTTEGYKVLRFRIEQSQPIIGSDPDITTHVFIDTSHIIARQTMSIFRIMHKMFCSFILYRKNTEALTNMPYIQFPIAAVSKRPNTVRFKARYGFDIIMSKISGLFIEVIDSSPIGSNPQIPISRHLNIGYVIRYQAMGIILIMFIAGETIVYIIVSIQSGSLGTYPHNRVQRIIEQTV